MSKIEEKIINNIKMLSLDMISSAGSGDSGIIFSGASCFYALFMNHLMFDPNNINWENRDRLVVSNRLIPLLHATNALFYHGMSVERLKEYKEYDGYASGIARNSSGIDMGSITKGDVIASAVGISLGREYLNSLINIEIPKSNLINFKTYCICTLEDLMTGISYEAMSYAGANNLNNLIYIVLKDEVAKDSSNKETFKENLIDRFISLNFNVEEISNNISSINGALEDARELKKPSIIIIKSVYGKSSSRENSNKLINKPLDRNEIDSLRSSYGFTNSYEIDSNVINEINKVVNKRMGKIIIKWQGRKQEEIRDLKVKEIIEFLNNKRANVKFKPENIKINENYEEELLISNKKVLNILASKSPFVLCGSDDNFIYTLSSINKSDIMTPKNRMGRNILFGNRTLAMGGISCGLASLGFKMFISTPLINESLLKPFMHLSSLNNLEVNYIFTNDTFINTYEANEYHALDEIDSIRSIPNLVMFRPADINEVIGMYDIISNLNKPSAIVIGSSIEPKFLGTNSKYVLAGAYRVKKEINELNAIIIASGSEVKLALRIAEELKVYNIDFRVISMPSSDLYELQSEKYKNMLLPKNIKTFTLEFSNTYYMQKYATTSDYALGINSFFLGGTKEEKLNYYNLNIDSLKTRIIELLKK